MNEQREESKIFFPVTQTRPKKTNWKFLPEKPWLRFRSFSFEFEFERKQKTISTHPQPVVDYLGLKWLYYPASSFCLDPEKKNFQIFHSKQNSKLMAKPNEKKINQDSLLFC